MFCLRKSGKAKGERGRSRWGEDREVKEEKGREGREGKKPDIVGFIH